MHCSEILAVRQFWLLAQTNLASSFHVACYSGRISKSNLKSKRKIT